MSGQRPDYYTRTDQCVDDVIKKVGRTIVLGLPLGLGKANHLANAFFRRAKKDPSLHLRILTALSLGKPIWKNELERRFLAPFNARIFGDYPELDYLEALRRNKLPPNVEISEFFFVPGRYLGLRYPQEQYISSNYTFIARDSIDNGLNVHCQMVSEKRFGSETRYSLSCNPDVSLDVVARLRAMEKEGRKTAFIGEVNANLPFMFGDAMVKPDLFDAIVSGPSFNNTLFSIPKRAVNTTDYMIGLLAGTLVKDGGTIQIGFGALGDAVAYGLQFRHMQNDVYHDLLQRSKIMDHYGEIIERLGGTGVFDVGLYGSTEMLVDVFLDLYQSGIIKRNVYDHLTLQKLLNEGKLSEEITSETLSVLIESKAIHSRMTSQDFDFLQYYGILKDELRFHRGDISFGKSLFPGDLSDEENLAKINRHCLGKRLKNGVLMHGGFFLGSQRFYDTLRNMSDEERRKIHMMGIDFTNQLCGNETLKTLQRKDARFMNGGLMVTLSGAVVSDGLENGQVISGVGGQYNFVAMGHALPGGRSIIMLRSTRGQDGELQSNIVWNYGHCTIPRHLRDIVVTEYGIAELRGRTDSAIIAALLNITDSRFQERLLKKAKQAGKIPDRYRIPDAFRNNLPQKIEQELAPFRKEGFFPAFPYGSDFTAEELVIAKALKALKRQTASRRLALPRLKPLKNILSVPQSAKPYLERLQLDKPVTWQEKLMQKIMLYALDLEGCL